MSTEAMVTSVKTSVTVNAPIDKAFKVFTQDAATWWPKEHHIIEAELQTMVFEPKVGGSFYDVGVDGSECRWARVLVYDPPRHVVFSWDISLAWQLEGDIDKTSEVSVTFTEEGPNRTLVELEHRHLDRHGEGWEALRDGVGGDQGWGGSLRAFAAVAGA